MTIAYFNLIGGLSGDMLLSSFFDLGLDEKQLYEELKKIKGIDFNFEINKTRKLNLNATHTNVRIKDTKKWNWADFYNTVKNSSLDSKIINNITKSLDILKWGEEMAHEEESPHLHELGTSDTLIDICGFFIAIDILDIKQIFSSSIPVAPGHVTTSHGVHETLAPATKKIVEKFRIPIRFVTNEQNIETITPTGISILASCAKFEQERIIFPDKFGLGAGTKDFGSLPNVVSLCIQNEEPNDLIVSKKILLESNIDDMSPEILGNFINLSLNEGALDCWLTNYYGKKNRSGLIINILCEINEKNKFINLILDQTTSLGLRVKEVDRYETERELINFDSSFGKIRVKLKYLNNKLHSFKSEFEDILEISKKTGLSFQEISHKLDYEIETRYKINN